MDNDESVRTDCMFGEVGDEFLGDDLMFRESEDNQDDGKAEEPVRRKVTLDQLVGKVGEKPVRFIDYIRYSKKRVTYDMVGFEEKGRSGDVLTYERTMLYSPDTCPCCRYVARWVVKEGGQFTSVRLYLRAEGNSTARVEDVTVHNSIELFDKQFRSTDNTPKYIERYVGKCMDMIEKSFKFTRIS